MKAASNLKTCDGTLMQNKSSIFQIQHPLNVGEIYLVSGEKKKNLAKTKKIPAVSPGLLGIVSCITSGLLCQNLCVH